MVRLVLDFLVILCLACRRAVNHTRRCPRRELVRLFPCEELAAPLRRIVLQRLRRLIFTYRISHVRWSLEAPYLSFPFSSPGMTNLTSFGGLLSHLPQSDIRFLNTHIPSSSADQDGYLDRDSPSPMIQLAYIASFKRDLFVSPPAARAWSF